MVRRVRESDWSALRDLRLRALRTDPRAFGSTYEAEERLGVERWRERARLGAGSADRSTWVAFREEGRLLGTAAVAETEEGHLQLFGMWVDPSVRRQGLGARLLDAALEWAHALPGHSGIRLEVNPRQEAALRLYASRGFRFTGARRPLGHTPGEFVHVMERPWDARAPSGKVGTTRRGSDAPKGAARLGGSRSR